MLGPAAGGILSSDGNAIQWGNLQGSKSFTVDYYGFGVTAEVDHAVYAPGQFNLTFPGQDPSNGDDYVYAYQILNLPDSPTAAVTSMTVGLDGDEVFDVGSPLGHVGWLGGTGDISPDTAEPIGSGPTSFRWDFPATFVIDKTSDILLFTSPLPPEWDLATVSGTFAAGNTLPSPIPEPMTTSLLVIGGFLLMRRRRSRT